MAKVLVNKDSDDENFVYFYFVEEQLGITYKASEHELFDSWDGKSYGASTRLELRLPEFIVKELYEAIYREGLN